jgi:TolB-like protein/Flp pilus assembly protein TadD
MGLVSELRRRNVLRMAVLYVVAAWLIMQVAEVIIGLAKLPDWIGTTTLILLAVGFPIALIVSWFYELTPEGISLEKDVAAAEAITHITGRRMDFVVIALLCAGLILFAYDKWWTGPPPEKSIAVLAFENMSGDPEQEYFSDGISEELLNALAKLPGLRVAARTSSFQFKGRNEDIVEIAAALNVAHILEGSVRKSGNKLRITAQLIKADDGFHLWSETYDRELDDVFVVQDEIAGAISEALKVKLALVAGETVFTSVKKAANTDAYDAYLQGRELIHHRNREAMEGAVRHLERSLRLDENFAPAHAQLAIASMLLTSYVLTDREEAWRKVIRHLDRAQELEPDLAEAHAGRALLAQYANDYESTIEHARRALASNPNYIDAMKWLSAGLGNLGRDEEADAILEQMLVTDPLSIVGRLHVIGELRDRGRIEKAHEVADQLIARSPSAGYRAHAQISLWSEGKLAETLSWALRASHNDPYVMLVFNAVGEFEEARRIDSHFAHWIDAAEGRWDEAVRAAQRYVQLYPDSAQFIADVAEVLYRAGRIDEALPLYERAHNLEPEGRPIPGMFGNVWAMQLALARRKAGDEEGAQAAAQIARQAPHAARRAAGQKNLMHDTVEAMIAAFDDDPDRAIEALQSAIRHGARWSMGFDDPIFEDLWDEPRFVALRQEVDALLAEEHEKVLQLICFNNPVPEDWQPMPETCEGVVQQSSL